jgi:hypothetical protein
VRNKRSVKFQETPWISAVADMRDPIAPIVPPRSAGEGTNRSIVGE